MLNDTAFPPTTLGRGEHGYIATIPSSKGRNCTLKRQITPAEYGGEKQFRSVEKNLKTKRVLDIFLNLNGGKWSSNVNRKVCFLMQTEMLQLMNLQ